MFKLMPVLYAVEILSLLANQIHLNDNLKSEMLTFEGFVRDMCSHLSSVEVYRSFIFRPGS